jgi:hypothetical protein
MGLPKNKKGFRTITFKEQKFNWRFSDKIDIRPELQKNNKLIVDFGWFDELLYLNDEVNRPPDFEPKTVTPEFVRQAISFALEHNWEIGKTNENFELKYKNGKFEIKVS